MNNYYQTLLEALEKHDVERRTFIDGREAIFQNGNIIAKNTDIDTNWDSADIINIIKPEPELAIFGAGHVSKALYDLAILQQMKITVIDERDEICSEERFPKAKRITGRSYDDILKQSLNLFRPYFVIMTHGHKYDNKCLRYALGQKHSYIGMIGSKGKVQATYNDLISDGYKKEELDKVYSPIGLKIGAVTPEEIAISIMAEIISVFRTNKDLIVLSPDYLKILTEKSGIVVRIIDKKGSAPRAVGSEMLVTGKDIYGTIGGGAVEKEAINYAKSLLDTDFISEKKEYNLSSSGDLGMICGGDVTLLFLRKY